MARGRAAPVRGRFVKGAHPQGRRERSRRRTFGIDSNNESAQRLPPAAGATLQRLPELGLQRDARAMPGNAEATLNQHAATRPARNDSGVNIPDQDC